MSKPANRFQSAEMVDLLGKVEQAEIELSRLREQLQKHCSHLFSDGHSAIPSSGISFRYCGLCNERC